MVRCRPPVDQRFWLRGQRERRTMTAAQPESLDTKGVRSLEVRWILPGQLTAGAAEFPSQIIPPPLPGRAGL